MAPRWREPQTAGAPCSSSVDLQYIPWFSDPSTVRELACLRTISIIIIISGPVLTRQAKRRRRFEKERSLLLPLALSLLSARHLLTGM